MLLEDLLEQEKREQQQNATTTGPMPGGPQVAQPPSMPPQPSTSAPMPTPIQQLQQQQQQQQQHQQQQQQQQPMQQQVQMPPGVPMQNPNPAQQMGVPQPQNPMGQPLPVGAVLQQVRPQGPPPGAFPGGVVQRPMMIQQQQGQMVPGQQGPQGQWQSQQVTLQQRGPMGVQPPHQIMGMRGPHPQRMPLDQQHPALMRQDPTPPPPTAFDTKPMTPPPENPQTDEERAHAVRYDQWLKRQEGAINDHLRHYETEISKLRKQRKVSHSCKRNAVFLLYFPFDFLVQ